MPSGFLRVATSLFHSPKSNTVAAPAWLTVDLAERGVRVVRRELRRLGRVGRDTSSSLRSAASCVEEASSPPRDVRVGLGLAVEQHLEQLAAERGCGSPSPGRRWSGSPRRRCARAARSCRCGSRSGRRRGARPVTPYVVSTMRPMPYVASLPIATCGARRASSASLRDVALAVRQLALVELHLHVLQHVAHVAPRAARRAHRDRSSSSRPSTASAGLPSMSARAATRGCRAAPRAKSNVVDVMPSGSNTLRLHRLVVGRAELELAGYATWPPTKPAGRGEQVRVLEHLAELARRLHRAERRRARPRASTPLNSSSHSRSCRGRPVHAQIRCLTSTCSSCRRRRA